MKTLISALILALVLMVSVASCSDSTASTSSTNDATVTQKVQISGPVAVESSTIDTSDGSVGDFLEEHWGKLLLGLLGFYDMVARLTPTSKDNSIVTFLTTVFNALISQFEKRRGKLLGKKMTLRLP